jgi:hypothetical protein
VNAGRPRGFQERPRAEDVVLDRLQHVNFHQRDMFVRRGVKDAFDTVGAKHLAYPLAVTDASDFDSSVELGKSRTQLQIQLVQLAFGDIERHNFRGVVSGDLSAQLGPNRPGGASHEHHASADLLSNGQ